jgi:hypothetical protein
MPADAFNSWLAKTNPRPAKAGNGKAPRAKGVPGSGVRGAVDLGGLTFAAPEK